MVVHAYHTACKDYGKRAEDKQRGHHHHTEAVANDDGAKYLLEKTLDSHGISSLAQARNNHAGRFILQR